MAPEVDLPAPGALRRPHLSSSNRSRSRSPSGTRSPAASGTLLRRASSMLMEGCTNCDQDVEEEIEARTPHGKRSPEEANGQGVAASGNEACNCDNGEESKGPHRVLTIVIIGASGDLAWKKTFPAIFSLWRQGLLPKDVNVVGYARSDLDINKFKQKISQKVTYFLTWVM